MFFYDWKLEYSIGCDPLIYIEDGGLIPVGNKSKTLVQKRALLPIGKPFSPSFPTGSTNPGLKGPSFSPGFSPGTKGAPLVPIGKTNRD